MKKSVQGMGRIRTRYVKTVQWLNEKKHARVERKSSFDFKNWLRWREDGSSFILRGSLAVCVSFFKCALQSFAIWG